MEKIRICLFQISELAKASIISRNRQGIVGLFWWCVEPMAIAFIYGFLVHSIFNYTQENTLLIITAVILQWRWFQQSIIQGSHTITSHKSLMTQIVLPYQFLPISEVYTYFKLFLPVFIALTIILSLQNSKVIYHIPELIFLIFVQFILTIAAVSIFAWIQVFFKEFIEIIRIGMRFMFYATPIIYSHHAVPQNFGWIWNINPLTYLFTAYRKILLDAKSPTFSPIIVIFLISVLLCILINEIYSRSNAALGRSR